METLQLPHAKLLYYITELYKQNEISEEDKTKLKELVIASDHKIFDILESWEENNDEKTLKTDLIALVKS